MQGIRFKNVYHCIYCIPVQYLYFGMAAALVDDKGYSSEESDEDLSENFKRVTLVSQLGEYSRRYCHILAFVEYRGKKFCARCYTFTGGAENGVTEETVAQLTINSVMPANDFEHIALDCYACGGKLYVLIPQKHAALVKNL